ncbi:MAG: hypothetical protein ACRD0Q_12120, partial [Acidimicrobiales bacterium]
MFPVGPRRSLAVGVALAMAVSAGCPGGSGSDPDVTVPEAPTTTVGSVDPYAVPAVIDEAYVNRV